MNTARKGRNTKNRTHRVLVTPDTEWSRNRSVKIWNKIMSQMKRKKNHSTDQKMSPNETSATITVSSLSGGPSGTSTAAAEVIPLRQATVKSCRPPIPHDRGLCAAPVRDQPAQVDRWASRCAGMDDRGKLSVRTARDGDRVLLVEIGRASCRERV